MQTIDRLLLPYNRNDPRCEGTIVAVGKDDGNRSMKSVAAILDSNNNLNFFKIMVEGMESFPSSIASTSDREIIIGQEANNLALCGHVFAYPIGKDSLSAVDTPNFFKGDTGLTGPETLQEFMVHFIPKLSEALGQDVCSIPMVISYPANFNSKQREILLQIMNNLGLNILGSREEPTQAFRSLLSSPMKSGNYIVLDIGGGTTDVSVIEFILSSDRMNILYTNAVDVAGMDFRNAINNLITRRVFDGTLPDDLHQLAEVNEVADMAKHELSEHDETEVILSVGDIRTCTLKREEFESEIASLIEKILTSVEEGLCASSLPGSDIEGIMLTGGSSKVPLIRQSLERTFPVPVFMTSTPLHDVALGNAMHAYQLQQEKKMLPAEAAYLPPVEVRSVLSHPISIVITKNDETGSNKSKDFHCTQIQANTPIPTELSVGRFRPFIPNQREAQVTITSGESGTPFNNDHILAEGEVKLRPSETQEEQVEVRIRVDESGIIKVFAKDLIGNEFIEFNAQAGYK